MLQEACSNNLQKDSESILLLEWHWAGWIRPEDVTRCAFSFKQMNIVRWKARALSHSIPISYSCCNPLEKISMQAWIETAKDEDFESAGAKARLPDL